MAFEDTLILRTSLPASGDLSSHQYKAVSLNSSGLLILATSGAVCIGVLQDNPNALNHAGQVAYGGVSKVLCNATLNPGDLIACDANGLIIAVGADTAIGRMISAGAVGKIGTAKLLVR